MYICFTILYEEELVHLLNSTTENIRKQTLALTFRRRLFAFSSLDPHMLKLVEGNKTHI